ncbi:glycoside hydrolase, family 16 [Niveomyces insectorum RCEF 264]|uniref:Glycoside hydrolase, family 16 n=1 Tax=Niveomyces insectorum RCEF 264 TaxID=1081102 RepID=A0A162J648_9HYPO|nr:glycoside hydrolase, family 16 [Niveomyces insectorum RCEF 264]
MLPSAFSVRHVASSFAVLGFVAAAGFARLAAADCECGYSATIDDDVQFFTDLIESDFAHLPDIATNTDWIRQAFNVTSTVDRGNYGEMYSVDNMRTQLSSGGKGNGQASSGQSAGLELTVKADLVGGMVPVSEIDTNRTDIMYGTFRAGMKLTNVSGTCSAFFWYFNDTQEIDMEFLSKEYNATNSSYPVNLVLQSRQAAEQGYNALDTGNYVVAYLPFDPTEDFHEYRIDFLPYEVIFYADNEVLATMDSGAVPTHPGHLVLQQWSNGNPLWSGGPPAHDSITTVSYVKAYFNSSSPQRQKDWALRCHDPDAPNAICPIPEATTSNASPTGWFFTYQNNMTNNQTVSGRDTSAGARPFSGTLVWSVLAVAFAIVGWELDVW